MSKKPPNTLLEFFFNYSSDPTPNFFERGEDFFISDDFFSLCTHFSLSIPDQLFLMSEYLSFFLKISQNRLKVFDFLLKIMNFWLECLKKDKISEFFHILILECFNFLLEIRSKEKSRISFSMEAKFLKICLKLKAFLKNDEKHSVSFSLNEISFENQEIFKCLNLVYDAIKLGNFEYFDIFIYFFLKNRKAFETKLKNELIIQPEIGKKAIKVIFYRFSF